MSSGSPTWDGSPTVAPGDSGASPDSATGVSGDPAMRYVDQGRIAQGAWGEIRRVWDEVLQRTLAMKVLHWEALNRPEARRRFEHESRVCAQLQHPGVVPVHDRGVLPDGRPWFTMREVRGRTLGDAIAELHREHEPRSWDTTGDAPGLRRLITAFEAVCQVMAFAHGRGVIHRDLKPDNIMLGAFGEVQVMDWGLARVVDVPEVEHALPPDWTGSGETRLGSVLGSPAYMAPEQAEGHTHLHEPRTDVYSLGAILYQILVGEPPYLGDPESAWRQVRAGPPVPLVARVGPDHPPLPSELVALCERAMARAPAERFDHAGELAHGIRAWLDGDHRRTRARAVVDEVAPLRARAQALRADAEQLRTRAAAALAPLAPNAPVSQKASAWDLQDRADALEREAETVEVDYLHGLRDALRLDPDQRDANDRVAAHLRARVQSAERRGDTRGAARHAHALHRHDGGRHRGWLQGDGALTLVTDPPGARVEVHRHERELRRLVLRPVDTLGPTPLHEVRLAPGSYALSVHAEGRVSVRYLVSLERREHWDGCPPNASAPRAIQLPGSLGDDDCWVAPGWFWSGGDEAAPDALSRRRLWVDGLVMRRFPVTNAQYLAFLNDLVAQGREREALEAMPLQHRGLASDPLPVFERDDNGQFRLGRDVFGQQWQADWPVVLVDWHGATAWARWEASRTGLPWRLPHDQEWEKAARGVDARLLPWGHHLDPTWTCMQTSADPPALASVHAYPDDESPWGVRGTAGNVRDWCRNAFALEGPVGPEIHPGDAGPPGELRVVRGGSWHSGPLFCRLAGRLTARPADRLTSLGFRVCRPATPTGPGSLE